MPDQPPLPIATAEDLRTAAIYVDTASRAFAQPEDQQLVFDLSVRLESLADRLDQLHATPGLKESMERLGSVWMNGTVAMNLRLDDLRTVLTAIAHLTPTGGTNG
jgi:hypothetical protein